MPMRQHGHDSRHTDILPYQLAHSSKVNRHHEPLSPCRSISSSNRDIGHAGRCPGALGVPQGDGASSCHGSIVKHTAACLTLNTVKSYISPFGSRVLFFLQFAFSSILDQGMEQISAGPVDFVARCVQAARL